MASELVERLNTAIDEAEKDANERHVLGCAVTDPCYAPTWSGPDFSLCDCRMLPVLRMCQAHRDIVAMFPVSAPHVDTEGGFYGFQSRDCGEHRTVGPHRAWCFDCSEWCYPSAPCRRCHGVSEVLRALARGYGIEDGETK